MLKRNLKFICLALVLFAGVFAHAQAFDLYDQVAGVKKPILIFVHGGAWVGGNKSQYHALAQAFNRDGLCVAVIDYRLAPAYPHPAPVEDLQSALEKLEGTSSKSCDGSRLYLMGHSAGAHMIAFWASQHRDAKIKGFIGLEGIYDLPKLVAKWPGYKDAFITAEFGAPAKWSAASPTNLTITHAAPWLLVHSAKDELVDPGQTTDFQKALLAQKKHVDYLPLATPTHFGVVEELVQPSSDLRARIVTFIGTPLTP